MRTTFLHVGTHKTGTTAIQWALNRGRVALEGNGLVYPKAGVPAGHHGHHNIGRELYGAPTFGAEHGSIQDLLDEVGASDRDVVLSSELFGVAAHKPERFASFVARLKEYTPHVVIVVYLRNQSGYARSLYLELLRHEYRETFEEFLSTIIRDRIVRTGPHSRYSFCYRDFLALLPTGDGVEIAVRFYDPTRAGSVVSDFLSVIDLKPADIGVGAEPRINPSLALPESLLAFYRNRRGTRADEARLINFVQLALADKTADLCPRSTQQLVAAFDDSNRFVNARFTNSALDTVAMHAFDSRSADIYMEHLFSEATVTLLDQVAELGALQAALEEERDTAMARRDAALDQRNAVLAERGEYAKKYTSASADRDAFAHERDAISEDRDRVIAERDSFTQKLNNLVTERDAMLRSRSWRITAPLRSMAGQVRKLLQR